MAGVKNNTAKQYNVKVMTKDGQRVKVMIAPGFNNFDDKHWGLVKNDKYVRRLKSEGLIDFGARVDDLVMDMDTDTKAKSKMEPSPTKKKKSKDKDVDSAEKAEEDDL